eukprot:s46_g18.t1
MTARVLEACQKNPILESHMSSHFSALKGADKRHERQAIMEELHRLGLGDMKEAKRRQGGESRCMEFHRHPLTPAISAVLLELNVPELLWPQAASSSAPLLSSHPGTGPHMAGSGVCCTFSVSCGLFHATLPHMTGNCTSSVFCKPEKCSKPYPFPSNLRISFPPMQGAGKRPAAAPAAAEAAEPASSSRRGRPVHEETPYTVTTSCLVELGFENKEEFHQHERKWASALLPNKCLNIRHQWYTYKPGFKVLLWCNSCKKCKNKGGWKGYSAYTLDTKKLDREYTPLDKHGEPTATKAWTPLTSTTENALKQFVANHARFTTQDLVKVVEKHQEDRPDDAWLQRWGNNHRPRREEGATPSQWVESDWRQLIRDLGTIHDLDAVTDCLKVAGYSLDDPKNTIIVFCNPELTATSLDMLENKTYVKLCGDGTFRLTEKEWIFLTLGALSKHYEAKESVFRTTFNPLLFALTNNESEQTYKFFFESACECVFHFSNIRLQDVCGQYHADLHWGEDAAQRQIFPRAHKVADWAHFIGACSRGSLPKKHPATSDEKFLAFRKGVFATAKNNLSPRGQTLLPLIERAFYCMRSVPTALLFHTVAYIFFDMLLAQNPPEEAAAKALSRYYFRRVPAAEARTQWRVTTWIGDPAYIYLADWWYGSQRLQPGSCSGTQAQESWHKHKLKSYMGLRASLPAFTGQLAKFTKSRLKALRASSKSLPDVPKEPFPDRAVLFDTPWLTKKGRSSAEQYHRTGAYDVYEHEGTAFFAMQRTLARYEKSAEEWKFTEDVHVSSVPADTAARLAHLCAASDAESLRRALLELDLSLDPFHLDKLLRLFNSSVLVVFGPEASRFWRRQPLDDQPIAPHTQGLCHFCHDFSVHGSCEHLHVAFLHLKLISLQAAEFPKRQRKANPMQEPPHILLPAHSRAAASSSVRKATVSFNWGQTSRFLAAHHADTWAEHFRHECVDIHMIASMGVTDLKAVLQAVPAGVLYRLHEAASRWLEEAPWLSSFSSLVLCFAVAWSIARTREKHPWKTRRLFAQQAF